jgi:hypothetical protein
MNLKEPTRPPFYHGDLVRTRRNTIGVAGECDVISVRRSKHMKSGWAVRVRGGRLMIYLDASLFELVTPGKARLDAADELAAMIKARKAEEERRKDQEERDRVTRETEERMRAKLMHINQWKERHTNDF